MRRGQVIKSTGSWYEVQPEKGQPVRCRVRGKFRQHMIKSTNPVAVGDWVQISGAEGDCAIVEIEERQNYIVRKSVNLSRQSHIIASNLDQAVMVATIKNPVTLNTFIDRFCVAAEAYHIPVAIVFNKIDLLEKEEVKRLQCIMDLYLNLGYQALACSAENGEGLEALKSLLAQRNSLLSGHSGVGKSTLINKLDPSLNLRTGHISTSHRTGQHTTTFAEMHPLKFGGYLVDTPGIRGFGLVDIEKEELAGYFPEMRNLLPNCKFYNCLHLTEPGCAVKEGVQDGGVAQSRYKSYLNMFENREETYR